MNNNLNKVLCGMKYGLEGEVIVNGKSFIQPMPGIPSLTELEIAEIATYIYNSWEHKKGLIEVNEVSKIVRSCESQ
jgi:cytochrome c551